MTDDATIVQQEEVATATEHTDGEDATEATTPEVEAEETEEVAA
jgi:hypothetical protein